MEAYLLRNKYFEFVGEVVNKARLNMENAESKFKSTCDYQQFFTQEGVEKRK